MKLQDKPLSPAATVLLGLFDLTLYAIILFVAIVLSVVLFS